MKRPVIVDTTIWSLLARRSTEQLSADQAAAVAELSRLLLAGRVVILGVVRQELLSGIRTASKWQAALGLIDDHPHELPTIDMHDLAARFYNRCAERGIAATNYDMLICAMADRLEMPIFTLDADFVRYARCLNIVLHAPAK